MIKQISTLLLSVSIAACCCVVGRFGTKTASAEESKYLAYDYYGGGQQYPGEETISYTYKKLRPRELLKAPCPIFILWKAAVRARTSAAL